MNRRSAIKGLGLLAGVAVATPHLIGSHADPVVTAGLRAGDILTVPRTGEKMVVTWVSSESSTIHVKRNADTAFEASDRLLA